MEKLGPKEDFKYEMDHDQFKGLVQEIQAVKAFNYKQFRKLTSLSTHLLKNNEEDDYLMGAVRELMSFNFKQFKKLNFIIAEMMKTIDPNWKPVHRIKEKEVR